VRKIEKDPASSPTHAIDEQVRPTLAPEKSSKEIQNLTAVIIYILICFAVLTVVVAGGSVVPLLQDLAFPLIMLIFLMMAFSVGYLIDIGRVMDTILYYLAHQRPLADRSRAGQDHLQGLVQMDPARPAGAHGGMHCLSADCRQH